MKWVALCLVIAGASGTFAALKWGREDTAEHDNALTRYGLFTGTATLCLGVLAFLILGWMVLS